MKNSSEPKRKRRFRLSLFAALTLVVIIGVCLGLWSDAKDSLFDSNVQTTLYDETPVGILPKLDPSRYFSEEDYDLSLFDFGLESCDINTPGTYLIPVYYEGKKTNCVVKLVVTGSTAESPSARQGSDDTKLQDMGAK